MVAGVVLRFFWPPLLLQMLPGDAAGDCSASIPRTPEPGRLPRVLPAPEGKDGIAVAWQQDEAILIQRLARDCKRLGPPFGVSQAAVDWRQLSALAMEE